MCLLMSCCYPLYSLFDVKLAIAVNYKNLFIKVFILCVDF